MYLLSQALRIKVCGPLVSHSKLEPAKGFHVAANTAQSSPKHLFGKNQELYMGYIYLYEMNRAHMHSNTGTGGLPPLFPNMLFCVPDTRYHNTDYICTEDSTKKFCKFLTFLDPIHALLPCIRRPPIQPQKYGLILKGGLKMGGVIILKE